MIRAVLDKVVVQPLEKVDRDDVSGFIVEDDASAAIKKAKVLSVGPGPQDMGEVNNLNLKPGDTVLYPAKLGLKYSDESGDYLILTENEVLGVVE